jgi:CBS domain containing-hemolysin-like protein
VLVGNTVAIFGAMWIVATALLEAVGDRSLLFWPCFFGAAFLVYMLCDLLPKTVFRKFPNRLCVVLSGPFRLLHMILAPLVSFAEAIARLLLHWTGGKTFKGQAFTNRNELLLLMEDTTSEALTSDERVMVHRVFDLNNIAVRQIAVPFARSPTVDGSEKVSAVLTRFRDHPQNVLAVWGDQARQRRITGFVEIKRLLFNETVQPDDTVAKHQRPALYVDENLRLHEALRRMQRAGYRTAVVLGRDRRQIGLITLEEILKFIFGEVKL